MPLSLSRRQIETVLAALVAAVVGVIGLSSSAETVLGPKFIVLQRIARVENPVYLTQPPRDNIHLYVVEKDGKVRVLTHERLQPRAFLDIRRQVKSSGKGGEQGLLSIAFPPDYGASGLFYVAYTDHRDALRIVEYHRSEQDPLVADRGSARLVMRIPQPTTKHHGGLLIFGPDGSMYIGSGDGGPSGDPNHVAQSKRTLLGKILRIVPRPVRQPPSDHKKNKKNKKKRKKPAPYTIPADNPLVGKPGRDEIWAYGLRNPWRFSFDRTTKSIAIGDVGNNRFEEVDVVPIVKARGGNFGWSAFEGNAPFHGGIPRSATISPTLAYAHGPGCAVTGGHIVRDRRIESIIGREVYGRYIYGDYCSGRLFAFRLRRDGKAGRRRSFRFRLPYLTSIDVDNSGRIYLLTQKGHSKKTGKSTLGSVYRMVPRRKESD